MKQKKEKQALAFTKRNSEGTGSRDLSCDGEGSRRNDQLSRFFAGKPEIKSRKKKIVGPKTQALRLRRTLRAKSLGGKKNESATDKQK